MSTILISIIISLLLPLAALSQPADIAAIVKSPSYLVGVGEDRDFDRADRAALGDLISQISVSVESDFKDVKVETGESLSSYTQSIVRSYSNAVLTNAERKIETLKGGRYKVYRYIRKEEKGRIFADRETKIREYVKTALRAEDVNDFDIALRSYYWALVLLNSHPDRNRINFTANSGATPLLSVWLPTKIEIMLKGVKIRAENSVTGSGNTAVYISAENQKGKIANLNLKYFDGAEFIEASIKDGKGVIYLPKDYAETVKSVDAMVDYQFLDLLGDYPMDEEVKAVAASIFVPFDNHTDIPIRDAEEKSFDPVIKDSREVNDSTLFEMTSAVVEAIKSGKLEDAREQFSDAGFEQFEKLMTYGKVSLYEGEHPIQFVKFGDRTLIRTIPLVIQLTDRNKRVIYDDICPIVENGKIVWVNFAINDRDAEDAIGRGDATGDLNERLLCLTFMEYYKTVFTLKDLDRVADIFRDDAIIFVGYVKGRTSVPTELTESVRKSVEGKNFELQKLTKDEYLERLRTKTFRNPFVNIQFSELEIVRRSESKPIYGIQLHQDYYSTNYADKGYLLLFTDNSDSTAPKIFFRCWQPEKFIDVSDIKIE